MELIAQLPTKSMPSLSYRPSLLHLGSLVMLEEETEGKASRPQISNQPRSFTGISTMTGHSFCKSILLLDRAEDSAIAYLRLALCAHIHMRHAHVHEQVRENCRHISFVLKDQDPRTWTIQLTFKSTS